MASATVEIHASYDAGRSQDYTEAASLKEKISKCMTETTTANMTNLVHAAIDELQLKEDTYVVTDTARGFTCFIMVRNF